MSAAQEAFAQASRYFEQGQLSLAKQYSWFALSQAPNDAETLQLLGKIAARQGELDRAIDYLNRSLICNGNDGETWRFLIKAHYDLGLALKAKGRLAEAAAAFQSAL